MHEMGLAMEVVKIVGDSIPADMPDAKVVRINLKVGKFSAVVPQSLKFCFEIVAKETAAQGAELHIEEIAVTAQCNDCQHQWEIVEAVFNCPKCNSGALEMLSGRELDIESIELEE